MATKTLAISKPTGSMKLPKMKMANTVGTMSTAGMGVKLKPFSKPEILDTKTRF